MAEKSCTNRHFPANPQRTKRVSKRDCGMLILATLHTSIGNLIALLLCSQSASYDSAGFEVEGCASVGNKEEIKKNQVHTKTSHIIRPNVQSVDLDNLIEALNRLSSGTGTSQDTKSEIETYAQHILSGDKLDPVQAVVIPLSSVSAVADKYGSDPNQQVECMLFVIIHCYRWFCLFTALCEIHVDPE